MRLYFNIDPQGSLSREERWVRNTELIRYFCISIFMSSPVGLCKALQTISLVWLGIICI